MENGRVLRKPDPDQAAELELPAALEEAGLESDDEPAEELAEDELEDELDEELLELDDFEAGELLDEAPRLSLR